MYIKKKTNNSALHWKCYSLSFTVKMWVWTLGYYKAGFLASQGSCNVLHALFKPTHYLTHTHSLTHSLRGGGRQLLNRGEMCAGRNSSVSSAKQECVWCVNTDITKQVYRHRRRERRDLKHARAVTSSTVVHDRFSWPTGGEKERCVKCLILFFFFSDLMSKAFI